MARGGLGLRRAFVRDTVPSVSTFLFRTSLWSAARYLLAGARVLPTAFYLDSKATLSIVAPSWMVRALETAMVFRFCTKRTS